MNRVEVVLSYLIGIAVMVGLGGCSEDELRLKDFRIVAVEVVKPSDDGIPDDAHRLGRGNAGVLKLVLGSNTDIRRVVDEHSLNLSVEIYDCANPTATALALAYVYDSSGVPLLPGYKSTENAQANTAASYIAIAASERETIDRTARLPAYDLRASPHDLCLQLRGGRMMGRPLRSNVVRLDAEQLRSALER